MSSAIKHKQRSCRSYRNSVANIENFQRRSYILSQNRAMMKSQKKQQHTDILGGLRNAINKIKPHKVEAK